jgi:hypothetical protein
MADAVPSYADQAQSAWRPRCPRDDRASDSEQCAYGTDRRDGGGTYRRLPLFVEELKRAVLEERPIFDSGSGQWLGPLTWVCE